MPRPLAGLAFSLAVASTSGAASAQGADSTALPPVVITATRVASPLARDAFATTVLTAEALQRAGAADVAEALRLVPGVTVARTGGPGAQASLFVRGGESDYARVLVDGVPVNDAGGAIDLSWLSLHDVERIEIVRGPSSVLHGTDAVTGVVQVFTRRGAGPARVEAAAESGRYGSTRGALSFLLGGATGGIALTAARDRSDGLLPFNNQYASDALSVRARLQVRDATHFDVTARRGDDTYHYPTDGAGALVDRNAWRADRRTTLAAGVAHAFGARWRGEVTVSSHRGRGRTLDLPDDAADTLGFHSYQSRGELARRNLGARAHYAVGEASVITLGADLARERQESVDSSNYDAHPNAFDADRWTRGYFAQWLAQRGRLEVSAGARYDDHEAFGDFRTARVALAWRAWHGGVLRASVGNAFKAPTFFESFTSGFSVGNPALVPERSHGWEAGVRHAPADGRLRVEATWFDQRFRDLIQYTFVSADAPNYFNVARASARGLELDAALALTRSIRATGAATFLRSRVEDAGFDSGDGAVFVHGQRLLRRPARSATVGIAADVGRRTTVDLITRYTGEREDRDFSTWPATPLRLPGFTRADVSATREVAPAAGSASVRLHVRLENVLGTRYEEVAGFPAPGRALVVGVRLGTRR